MSNTGYKYIYKVGTTGRYQIKIWDGASNKCFGTYKTLEEAIEARSKRLKELGLTLYLDK